MKKKGDLSLSVNAIVVFVLAFAMLGVGLFLVQLIKGQAATVTEKAFDIKLLEEKPDATRTIIFPDTLRLAPGGTEKPVSGFYNIGLVETDADTFPLITNCKAGGKDVSAADSTYCTAGTKNEANCLPKVSGSVGVVPRAKGVGFKVIITDQDKLSSGTTYICDFVITSAIKSAETTGPNYYDKMQFFLEIGK